MDDIQSWSEVPSIAHFCSLFRAAFNLLDFDIEELEEALLTDGTEDAGSSLLQELIVRLLCGCIQNNEISTFNYQMFLRRLFRQKCHEYGRENPFNTDIDFQFLPLRTKVEILHALCDFRLDADDVQDLLKNLESDSLRVEPLGHDENKSAYWYFYGTRLYREDFPKNRKKMKEKRRKSKEDKRKKKSKSSYESDIEEDILCGPGVWQVVCYTEQDWDKLASRLKGSTCKEERSLHRTLTEDFLPEIPRLFAEKERLQRKRMMEYQPRRQSSRLEKIKQKEEQEKVLAKEEEEKLRLEREERERRERLMARAVRAINRGSSRSGSECGSYRSEERMRHEVMEEDDEAAARHGMVRDERGHRADRVVQDEDDDQLQLVGRQTNNSLSSATGQIFIQPPRRKKLRSKHVFKTTPEDLRTGMYKILDHLKNHEEAWPFVDAVDENYAPRYYSVIRKPMDLQTMEEKLDAGEYLSLNDFRADFQLIVDNCRQYNGWENEYTEMVRNLQDAFQDAMDRYFESDPSSDEEVAVEFPSGREGQRRHKSADYEAHKRRRRERESERANKENRKARESMSDHSDDSTSKPPCLKPQRVRSPLSERSGSIPGSDFDDREPDFLREHSPPQLVKAVDELDSGDSSMDSSKMTRRDRDRNKLRRGTGVMKNAAAIEALSLATEQTLKDINKWLDDTPRFSEFSSASNSPCPPEEVTDKPKKKELQAKRRRHHDSHKQQPRRKEVQRTIERLQPGKSKGNLITNLPKGKEMEESGITIGLGLGKLVKESRNALLVKTDETAPKLSLGTVLKTDIIGFGKNKHSFDENDRVKKEEVKEDLSDTEEKPVATPVTPGETKAVVPDHITKRSPEKTDLSQEEFSRDKENEHAEKTKEEEKLGKEEEKTRVAVKEITNKNKATPNLSAWFKAFGAPKAPSTVKRKPDLNEPPPTPGRGLADAFKSDKPEAKESDRLWLNDAMKQSRDPGEAPASVHSIHSVPSVPSVASVELEEPPSVPSMSVPSVASVASPMPSPDVRPDPALAALAPAPRQRKASTSSSLSERSSFSQDPTDGSSPHLTMDERLGAPYPSPLHPSPYPSPKGEDLAQKSAYTSINGTIRVGFYQDTSSNLQKSSPEKQSPNSNSPRDQGNSSPFQSYSHVYPPTVSQPGTYNPVPHPTSAYPTYTSTPTTPNLYEGLSQYTLPTMMNYSDPSYRTTSKPQENYLPPRQVYLSSANPEPSPKPPSSVFPVKKRLYAEIEAGRLQIPNEPPVRQLEPPRPPQQLQPEPSPNINTYADPNDSLGFCRLQAPTPSDMPQYERYGQQRMHGYHHDVSDLSKQMDTMDPKDTNMSRLQQMPTSHDFSKMQVAAEVACQSVDKTRTLGSLMDNLGRLQQGPRSAYAGYTITEDNDGVFRNKDQAVGRRPNQGMPYQGMDPMDPAMLRPNLSNLSNLSHIVDRYQTESFYSDKNLSNMYGKNMANFSQSVGLGKNPGMQQGYNTELNIPKPAGLVEATKPPKSRKKQAVAKSAEPPCTVASVGTGTGTTAFQQYVSGLKPSEPSAISLKTASVVPGSAFNFGPAPAGLGLPNPLYTDSGLFDELRQQQGSYYSMVAAAHHGAHRATPEATAHGPPRGSPYQPFMNQAASLMDTAAYQQYIQRFQEEQLQLRHSAVPVLHQSLYPPGYHPALGIPRQPYDRPSWL